ncbi:MAG: flagellar assembly protein FliW [Tumebacillaceae bacterium]
MEIKSIILGTVDVEEEQIFRFQRGLYGLEDYQNFALIVPDSTLPFAYLQAVEEPGVCLLLADPFQFYPHYAFDLAQTELDRLQASSPELIAAWTTVTTPRETLEGATLNLLAPIVLNVQARLGCQVVLHDSGYDTKSPLFPAQKEE